MLTVAFAAIIGGLAWGGEALTRGDGPIAALWLSNALVAAVLLRSPRRQTGTWLAAAFAGYCGAGVVTGAPLATVAVLAAINCAEVAGGCWLLLRWTRRVPDVADFGALVRFELCCALIAPTVSGLFAALWFFTVTAVFNPAIWLSWSLADGLGMLIGGPIALIAIDAWRTRHWLTRARSVEVATVLGGTALAAMIVFGQSRLPLLFLATPMVIVAAFRLGTIGTAASVAVVSLVATIATLLGKGPIFLIVGGIELRIHVLQLFLAACFGIGVPIASALAGRDRIRQDLRAARDFSETLLVTMQEVVFRTDAHGRWVFLNPAWTKLTGYGVAESLGWYTTKLLHPDDIATARDHYPRIVSGDVTEAVLRQRFFDSEGHCRNIEVTLRRVAGADGAFGGTVGSIRDISENVAAQRALAESEERFRRLAEAAPVGIFRADADGSVTYVNKAWSDKIGLSIAETLGHGWKRALAPRPPGDEEPFQHNYVPGESRSRELVFRRPDGSELWVQGVTNGEFDETGALTGYIGAIVDISEQRRARLALAESQRLFEALANLSPAGIFRSGPDGGVTYVNQAWMRFAGLAYEESMGSGWGAAIHPRRYRSAFDTLGRCRAGIGRIAHRIPLLSPGRVGPLGGGDHRRRT